MYIYNVTVNVDEDVHERWLGWMQQIHIPDVMATGCFTGSQMLKVLGVEDLGHTYSVQYRFNAMSDIETYQRDHAPRLQAHTKKEFGDKYTAFRTLLQLM